MVHHGRRTGDHVSWCTGSLEAAGKHLIYMYKEYVVSFLVGKLDMKKCRVTKGACDAMRNHLQESTGTGKVAVGDGTARKSTAVLQNCPEENKGSDLVIPSHFALNKKLVGKEMVHF